MTTQTLSKNNIFNCHEILVQKENQKYRIMINPERGIAGSQKKTEDGWKSVLNLPEKVQNKAEEYREEEMK